MFVAAFVAAALPTMVAVVPAARFVTVTALVDKLDVKAVSPVMRAKSAVTVRPETLRTMKFSTFEIVAPLRAVVAPRVPATMLNVSVPAPPSMVSERFSVVSTVEAPPVMVSSVAAPTTASEPVVSGL